MPRCPSVLHQRCGVLEAPAAPLRRESLTKVAGNRFLEDLMLWYGQCASVTPVLRMLWALNGHLQQEVA